MGNKNGKANQKRFWNLNMPTGDWKKKWPGIAKERQTLIGKMKQLIPHCEISRLPIKLAAHEWWLPYNAKMKEPAVRLALLHPANIVILNNDFHINAEPNRTACLKAIYRRPIVIWSELGFVGPNHAIANFVLQLERLYADKVLKTRMPVPDDAFIRLVIAKFNEARK